MRRRKHLKACHYTSKRNHVGFHPHQEILPIEIVKLEDNSYHLLLSIEINGIEGHMIIDTGASVTVMDKNLLEENDFGETNVKIESGSVSGQIDDVKVVRTKSIKIAGKQFTNIRLAAIDLDYVNGMYARHLKRKIIG